jgi:hypothetical protein
VVNIINLEIQEKIKNMVVRVDDNKNILYIINYMTNYMTNCIINYNYFLNAIILHIYNAIHNDNS